MTQEQELANEIAATLIQGDDQERDRIAHLIATDEPYTGFLNAALIATGRERRRAIERERAIARAARMEQMAADEDIRQNGARRLLEAGAEGRNRVELLAQAFEERHTQFSFPIGDAMVSGREIARRLRAGADFATYYHVQSAGVWWRPR